MNVKFLYFLFFVVFFCLYINTVGRVNVRARSAMNQGDVLKMQRGTATIPLPGIDVPFHSRFLRSGVASFRETLKRVYSVEQVERALPRLLNLYVPNVIAKPFSLNYEYVEEVVRRTSSEELQRILSEWSNTSPAQIATTLLVELLAYQFASPVQWIETQTGK